MFRYSNASFVDERHRHRYEVTVSHRQICGSTLHEEKKCNKLSSCNHQIPKKLFIFKQVNPNMVPQFENAGLSFVGRDETGQRMEVSFCESMVSDVFHKVCITFGVRW